ncbi:MAG: proton-conducting transporter membrane subunit [Candidatus Puniceispirillales bacterium]|mgnify:FL=1
MIFSSVNFITLALLPPLIAPLLIYIFKSNQNIRDSIGVIGSLISFYATINITTELMNGSRPELFLFNIFNDLSLSFKVTPLGAVFGLLCSGLWILAAIYSIGYMRGNNEKNQTRFYIFYSLSIFGALCVAWSSNLLVLFIFYEFLTFATYPLVVHKETEDSIKASRLYLGILVGSSLMLFLPAIIWVWYSVGTLNFTDGGILQNSFNPSNAPILLFLFVFGIGKAALMPLHWWLPAAMVAPTPVSALLHAVAVVKAGVFSILMVICYIFGPEFMNSSGSGTFLIWASTITLFLSSVIAITKNDIKARLAYSTVSQLSYIILGGAIATNYSLIASVSNIMMHGVGKITLFFCAGAIYVSTKITKISDLNGLGHKMPLTFFAFSIGALSIIGIPPFGGSWSKFYLLLGAAQSELTIIIIILAISTLLNTYYLLDPVFRAFFMDKNESIKSTNHPLTVYPAVCSAFIVLLLFFYIEPLLELVNLIIYYP